MTTGHPAGLPVLFLDRGIVRRQVRDLLRAAGIRLHTLAEVYGIPADEQVSDVDWLGEAGERGWPVLMKDDRIRYRTAERAAVIAHGVQAFCLSSGNPRGSVMVDLGFLPEINLPALHARPTAGPPTFTLSPRGRCRTVTPPTTVRPAVARRPPEKGVRERPVGQAFRVTRHEGRTVETPLAVRFLG